MSFRDDHDAALARAESLEREVETLRAKAAEATQEADAERKRSEAAEKRVAELERENARLRIPRIPAGNRTAKIIAAVAVALALATLAFGYWYSHRERELDFDKFEGVPFPEKPSPGHHLGGVR